MTITLRAGFRGWRSPVGVAIVALSAASPAFEAPQPAANDIATQSTVDALRAQLQTALLSTQRQLAAPLGGASAPADSSSAASQPGAPASPAAPHAPLDPDPLRAVIDAPAFTALDRSVQQVALTLDAEWALRTREWRRAFDLATRANALSDQNVIDWSIKVQAAVMLNDQSLALTSLTDFGRHWGRALTEFPDETILRVTNGARTPALAQARFDLLQMLYDARWQPRSGRKPDLLWRDLSLMLIERRRAAEAAQVASHVHDPYQLVILQSDVRYKPVLSSGLVSTDVRRSALDEIARSEHLVQSRPHSLASVVQLANAEVAALQDARALELTAHSISVVQGKSDGVAAVYADSAAQLSWIYHAQAKALRDLGRFEEALDSLQRAVSWSGNKDPVSHKLNLAAALCELDRPQEALRLLPDAEQTSAYGRTVMALVRATAAAELDDTPSQQAALAELRASTDVSPTNLFTALITVGDEDAAAEYLVARLRDPFARADALLDIQMFAKTAVPPRVQRWRQLLSRLRERADVREALRGIGSVRDYPLRERLF
ncbi:MAG TPA: hypothetical protein VME21_14965 [Steroidobacteraceae bacterium]|nr:hypothetical protein [Steroidobacteraceae bacterium]